MLVAAIMDIVTSRPGHAETGDIAAAIQVLEEGGIHLDVSKAIHDDEDGGIGIHDIGM